MVSVIQEVPHSPQVCVFQEYDSLAANVSAAAAKHCIPTSRNLVPPMSPCWQGLLHSNQFT